MNQNEEDKKEYKELTNSLLEEILQARSKLVHEGIKADLKYQKGGQEWPGHVKILIEGQKVSSGTSLKEILNTLGTIRSTVQVLSLNKNKE